MNKNQSNRGDHHTELCEPQATLYMLPTLIMNIVTDICIMAIPAPVVLRAKMSVFKKISLILLFSGGFFIMIAAILRVTFVMVVSQGYPALSNIISCSVNVLTSFSL
jgi:hypothetical protein